MAAPRIPRLTPVSRLCEEGGVAMIPLDMLVRQVQECERFGTWALAQALAEFDLMSRDPAANNPYHVGRMSTLLSVGGAALGSINGRTTAFRFLMEVQDGKLRGGDWKSYERAGQAR